MRILLALILLVGCQREAPSCTHFRGWAMTMPYHVIVGRVTGEEQARIAKTIQECFEEVNASVNNWNPKSEISRFNGDRAGVCYEVSEHLGALLDLSEKVHALSEGRFDPTLFTGWKHLRMEGGMLSKDCDEVKLDLCAVSKGYCIDLIVERVPGDLFVEWAGEIRTRGRHPDGRDWIVEIEPNGERVALVDQAIATSGNYGGPSHIIDPIRRMPMEKGAESVAAVTVIAPNCALADALATAGMAFSTGLEARKWAEGIGKEFPEVSIWVFER